MPGISPLSLSARSQYESSIAVSNPIQDQLSLCDEWLEETLPEASLVSEFQLNGYSSSFELENSSCDRSFTQDIEDISVNKNIELCSNVNSQVDDRRIVADDNENGGHYKQTFEGGNVVGDLENNCLEQISTGALVDTISNPSDNQG